MNLVDNYYPLTDNIALNIETNSNSLADIDWRVTYYARNVKRQKQLRACDETRKFSKAFVFVQFIGLKMGENFDNFLISNYKFDEWPDKQ